MKAKTRSGVYFDLEKSPYLYQIGPLEIRFASAAALNRFCRKWPEYLIRMLYVTERAYGLPGGFTPYPLTALSLYVQCEKRGFYAVYNNMIYESLSDLLEEMEARINATEK